MRERKEGERKGGRERERRQGERREYRRREGECGLANAVGIKTDNLQ